VDLQANAFGYVQEFLSLLATDSEAKDG